MLKLIVLGIALFSSTTFAMTPDEIKEAIHARMSERHPQPDPNFWPNLGPDALPVIKEMYRVSTSPIEQAWLIDGLSHFTDPSVAELLESSIKSSDNDVFKKKMLSALIQSQGDASFDFVEPYLKDKDAHVRLAVAKGIQKYIQTPAAQTRLTQYKKSETESWAKAELEKPDPDTNFHLKRAASVFSHDPVEPTFKPLAEKDWAGDWIGVFINPKKNVPAIATLTYLDKVWKVELKLPKQSKYELKRDQLEVLYYQTAHAHWIEVRNKKDDSVFVAQKKGSP